MSVLYDGRYGIGSTTSSFNSSNTLLFCLAMVLVYLLFRIFKRKRTDELGRGSWALLHTISARYSRSASLKEQEEMKGFLHLFAKWYPCDQCSEHMLSYLQQHPPNCSNRDTLQRWICELHNKVNEKLGKPMVDCGNVLSIHSQYIGNEEKCASCT